MARKAWAIARELWGNNAEIILRAAIALNLGKLHLTEMLDEDWSLMINWMEAMIYGG